jgi:hypothetical protein
MWRPREAQDFVGMGLECVDTGCWFTQVVETNRLDSLARVGIKGVENSTNLVCASRDEKPLLGGVVSDRENFFVVGLVFVGRVGPSSSVPTSSKN